MSEDGDDYFVPLEDQSVFGAGIKRKGIAFVPASSIESFSSTQKKPNDTNAGDRYLSIVLPESSSAEKDPVASEVSNLSIATGEDDLRCAICHQLMTSINKSGNVENHEATIAHQVCLQHSNPPSHLDKSHVGLKYLSAYGWDPDSSKGLGARHDGIRIPIKALKKNDTTGLRERIDDDEKAQRKLTRPKEKPIAKMNAKDARKYDDAVKKRAEKLRTLFYDEKDLEHYLGPAG